MRFSRRDFLGLAGGAALVAGTASLGLLKLGPSASTGTLLSSQVPLPQPFSVPLPIPPVAKPVSGTDSYRLATRPGTAEILPGLRTPIWGYDGLFPGPTIMARSGREVTVDVRNELTVPTVVHLHGGRTPPESDGYPTDLILPADGGRDFSSRMTTTTAAGSRTYAYPLQQRAATLWYHDHTMDFTGPNVYRGLAGFFLVSDEQEANLPLPRGDRDLPLLVCDRSFNTDGSFRYPALADDQSVPGVQADYMGGVLGDTVLVNGAAWPLHEVDAARYRLRLLNASNARRFEFALDPPPPSGSPFVQIATDGGLLEAPIERDSVTLASAERAEVLVDFAAYPVGTSVTLVNRLGSGTTATVMRFDIVRAARGDSSDTALPEVLSVIEPLDRSLATNIRTFDFQLRRGSSAHAGHAGGNADAAAQPRLWTINGQPFDPAADLATPRLGDVEIWRLMTDLHHPVHLHLAPFRVLSRGDSGPGPGERGWKDTIDLIPGQTAEIITRFDGYRGRYVFHCHNLEHEDMAMMANFSVS